MESVDKGQTIQNINFNVDTDGSHPEISYRSDLEDASRIPGPDDSVQESVGSAASPPRGQIAMTQFGTPMVSQDADQYLSMSPPDRSPPVAPDSLVNNAHGYYEPPSRTPPMAPLASDTAPQKFPIVNIPLPPSETAEHAACAAENEEDLPEAPDDVPHDDDQPIAHVTRPRPPPARKPPVVPKSEESWA